MRIIFAGTPEFSAQALKAIVDAGIEVCLVLTQPDRPKGRGLKLQTSAVKQLAEQLGLPVAQPTSLKSEEVQNLLRAQNADVMVVVAYGLLLPQAVLDIPRFGCLNIHASLLPRWRGAAPIQRAIEAGDTKTGITIMQMDVGLDTGNMLSVYETDISSVETAQTLYERLAHIGATGIVETLQNLSELTAVPQPDDGVTYAHKLTKDEAKVRWSESALMIERKVRAFNPAPCAWTTYQDAPLKIWQAKALDGQGAAGHIVKLSADEIIVGTGNGLLSILELQAAGAKRLHARSFLQGSTLKEGSMLGESE